MKMDVKILDYHFSWIFIRFGRLKQHIMNTANNMQV